MANAVQHRIVTPKAILVASAVWLAVTAPCVFRLSAQEPGSPPETAAPEPATPEPDATAAAPAQSQRHRGRPGAVSAENTASQPALHADSPPVAPPEPETPKWPVNERPGDATVTWDSHGLSIDAANSSLQQIMKDVSTATGTTVDGLNGDERIFGAYGPGQARDVLSQLLQGAGYNVIMVGDQGQGAPRQIVLTARREGGSQNAANGNSNNSNDDDSADDADDQPAQPGPPARPGFPGGPPRTPQQMMQDRQERMQQMRQMQQQGGAPPGQNPNPN
jgi:hypothetical protein